VLKKKKGWEYWHIGEKGREKKIRSRAQQGEQDFLGRNGTSLGFGSMGRRGGDLVEENSQRERGSAWGRGGVLGLERGWSTIAEQNTAWGLLRKGGLEEKKQEQEAATKKKRNRRRGGGGGGGDCIGRERG